MSDIIEQLELFSETVDRIMESRFVKWTLEQKKISVKWKSGREGLEVTKNWPDEDMINGFLLPFRMLVMGQERVSWRKMGELYETLSEPEPFVSDFCEARENLNEYLETPTNYKFDLGPKTNRDLMHVFLYGYYSHSDKEKRERIDYWKSLTMVWEMIEFDFINIVITISDLSYQVSEKINKSVIEYMKKQ